MVRSPGAGVQLLSCQGWGTINSMRIQIAQIAASLLQRRRHQLLHDPTLPMSIRGAARLHFEKAWIPNFWAVAICAPRPGSESYFDFPIGVTEDGTPWFFPSQQWWIAHAKASHPPDGKGCNADVHTDYLSREGSKYEFDYATIFTDGTLKVLGRADFVEECAWWKRAFAPPRRP